jgi:membrane protein DedA with SNARE-associated domain
MFDFLEKLFFLIKDIVSQLGYLGIGGGMLIESMCIPLPSEAVLPVAGFMVADGTINFFWANIAVAIGSMIGSLIAYFVGYYGGRPFILKYGMSFFISEDKFNKADHIFNKYGGAAVFFGRLLPIIRTFISLPAGIAKMDLKKFVLFSLAGMLPWNAILIYLGYKFGANYETVVRPVFKKFEYVVVAIIILAILFIIYHTFASKRRKKLSE